MLRKFEFVNGSLVPSESDCTQVYFYIAPDASEKEQLKAVHGIDNHTLSSALDPDEVSRIEFFSDRLFMIWKRPISSSGHDGLSFDVASVGLLLTSHSLVIISAEDFQIGAHEGASAPEQQTLLDVLLGVLSRAIQDYLVQLKTIKRTATDLQGKINASLQNEHLLRMFNLSEGLVYFINAVSANSSVLTRLQTYARRDNLAPRVIDHIDDLIIENMQCYRLSTTYSTVFAGLMDARGNIINNNMNILIRNLTFINIVFLPLGLIAGIGGMSEFTMMTAGVPWPIAYSAFVMGMVLLGWLTAILLKRAGFMGSATGGRK